MSERILVVGPAWVGDMVMAQSLFISLQQRDPETAIDVLAPAWSLPLLARMPQIRRGVEIPIGHGELKLSQRRSLGRSLRGEYDRAIVLPRSLKSALVPWFARIPQRVGYCGEQRYGLINDMRTLDKALLPQTVQRFVALGEDRNPTTAPKIPTPRLRIEQENKTRLISVHGLQEGQSLIGFMPGAAYGPAKQWPPRHFGMLARALQDRGHKVCIFGSEGERELGEQIRAIADGRPLNLCGSTELVDTVDLLDLCKAAVTNDSGLMHVAAAVGTRVVALYGSSTPAYTPPLTDRADLLYLGMECSPCFERRCPLGHTNCLTQINIQRVLSVLES